MQHCNLTITTCKLYIPKVNFNGTHTLLIVFFVYVYHILQYNICWQRLQKGDYATWVALLHSHLCIYPIDASMHALTNSKVLAHIFYTIENFWFFFLFILLKIQDINLPHLTRWPTFKWVVNWRAMVAIALNDRSSELLLDYRWIDCGYLILHRNEIHTSPFMEKCNW